jgi:hypothetical protein
MTPLSAPSGCFSREIFQDGARVLILSNCQGCGEAQIGNSYDGSLQEWESCHVCGSRTKTVAA